MATSIQRHLLVKEEDQEDKEATSACSTCYPEIVECRRSYSGTSIWPCQKHLWQNKNYIRPLLLRPTRGTENRPLIHSSIHSSNRPVIHSFLHLLRQKAVVVVFMFPVCGFFSQAQCAVDSGSQFALIKFNRPVWVPQDRQHAGWQQSNADFHYLQLQWPNYSHSDQCSGLHFGFHYRNVVR